MPITAPETPTTVDLLRLYGSQFSEAAQDRVAAERNHVSDILRGENQTFLGIVGPCAMTDTVELDIEGDTLLSLTQDLEDNLMQDLELDLESDTLQDSLQNYEDELYYLHRMPPWKPRTNPEDWHGLETTDPAVAYQITVRRALRAVNVSMEFGQPYHPERYGRYATFGWIGSRNVEKTDFIRHVAAHPETATMPLGVMNGLTGDVTSAIEQVNMVNRLRGSDAAPAVLIYRGGEAANSPEAWERLYLRAREQSNGLMIVDMAHGAEMAHHPDGQFKKSVEGQIRAQAHYLELEAQGLGALGLMHEASSAKSQVDPPIPLDIAVNGIQRAARLRSSSLTSIGKL